MKTTALLEVARVGLARVQRDRLDVNGRGMLAEAAAGIGVDERPDWLAQALVDLRPELPALPLRTERLTLRLPRMSDLDWLGDLLADEEVTRYLPFDPLSREAVRERIETFQAPDPTEQSFHLKLIADLALPTTDPTPLAELTLKLTGPHFCVAEIGWVLRPAYEGHGYVTEAAVALVEVARTHFGAHRIVAHLDPRNTRSAAVCERLGMTHETTARRDYWCKGEWGDSAAWALVE